MAIRRSVGRRNNNNVSDNGSKKIFELRRSGQLQEAYILGIKLFELHPEDEWIQKAYAWVLIDIIKNEIKGNSGNANSSFSKLLSINIRDDEIILKQISFLRPKLDPNYQEVQDAENLSKNGNHTQALEVFRQLKRQGKLSQPHHESFGWSIYRYIKASKDNLSVDDVKKLLFEYLKLENPRPSLLHSIILGFSVRYDRYHNQFNLYIFFSYGNQNT